MNLVEIFCILLVHWFADFVCQTDEQAVGKSKNKLLLLEHTLSYTLVLMIAYFIYVLIYLNQIVNPIVNYVVAVIITLFCHTITDFYTSKLNAKLWNSNKRHLFFVSIGFDQILHYIQLFMTFYYLKHL